MADDVPVIGMAGWPTPPAPEGADAWAQLGPERTARLLRAKAAELEANALSMLDGTRSQVNAREDHATLAYLVADVALLCGALAALVARLPPDPPSGG